MKMRSISRRRRGGCESETGNGKRLTLLVEWNVFDGLRMVGYRLVSPGFC